MPYASNDELPKSVRSDDSVSSLTKEVQMEGRIVKRLDEQRLVYGWAYVSTVKGELSIDHSQECIKPEEIVKATTNFMLDVRVAKSMHQGDQVGEVVHSLPVTKEIGEALGIKSDYEGWIIAMKINDDEVWKRVKSGELAAFSIGGRALRESLDDR